MGTNTLLKIPQYKVAIVTDQGKRCLVTPAVTRLNLSQGQNEIAQKSVISLFNTKCDGTLFTSLFKPRNRVFVYANTGEGDKEVFRGFLWEKHYTSALEKELTYTCYDNLIYFQESSDSLYFSAGQSTENVCKAIFEKWGIPVKYNYHSIVHSKLLLRGSLSDILITDLLEPVRKQTGKKYVVRSKEDVIYIDEAGSNTEIYKIAGKSNALKTKSTLTMSGMVTQVIITGKADDEERTPVEVTVSRNTEKYGTLQKVLTSSDADSLADAKREADETLGENSSPVWSASVEAIDIPWLRKGDKVELAAGDLGGKYIVSGIMRDCMKKTMELELER